VIPTDFLSPSPEQSCLAYIHIHPGDDQSPALRQEQMPYRRQQLCGKQHDTGRPVIKAHVPVTKKKEGKKNK